MDTDDAVVFEFEMLELDDGESDGAGSERGASGEDTESRVASESWRSDGGLPAVAEIVVEDEAEPEV